MVSAGLFFLILWAFFRLAISDLKKAYLELKGSLPGDKTGQERGKSEDPQVANLVDKSQVSDG